MVEIVLCGEEYVTQLRTLVPSRVPFTHSKTMNIPVHRLAGTQLS